ARGGGMKRRDFLRYGAIGMVAAAAPALTGRAAAQSGEIVACAIHPAFGIARVGNSPDEIFLGPEVPGPHPLPAGGFKDGAGRIKRQAARFRVFGLDAARNVVKELPAAAAQITSTVHPAHLQAARDD